MAVGMTFVIANKDLDLSVGSTFGLVGVAFAYVFDPNHFDHRRRSRDPVLPCAWHRHRPHQRHSCHGLCACPSFIATLTMLFIGRGFVLGLTGGQSILYPQKAAEYRWFFHLGEFNALGFNNQIPIALAVVAVGAVVLAKTRWGYETFATGGNEQAAIYAGIPTQWVRVRAYLLSSLCATVAGADGGGPGQGHLPAGRPQCRADRHRRRDHRRRIDPRRTRPRHRQLHRRAADGAHQQGAARGPADHPHRDGQRREGQGAGDLLAARPAPCPPSSACC